MPGIHADETTSLLPANSVNGHAPRNHVDKPSYAQLAADLQNPEKRKDHTLLQIIWIKLCVIFLSNIVNWLLLVVPVGLVAGILGWSPSAIFALNFVAIIPLAALLGFATEQLAIEAGETLGGLCNATFGNAVELIVSIVALTKGEIRVVQASMLGSILSNLLLVLGMCFLCGGLKYKEQNFSSKIASTMSSLMAVATSSLIIPAALVATLPRDYKDTKKIVLDLSHYTAIVMLILYVMYLVFQMKTHKYIFDTGKKRTTPEDPEQAFENGGGEGSEDEEEDEPILLTVWESGFLLLGVTLLVAWCAEYLVGSIEGLVESSGISKTFIGLILIPIVGNAAEHVTAIFVAMKNKMNLAIGVAIGSSMQIALLVTPFLVILGWIIGQPMSLHFQTFETVIFFVSTYLCYHTVQDGVSNYLEGAMLLGIYFVIAVSFYVYPDSLATVPGGGSP